jgi:hypothetical protein
MNCEADNIDALHRGGRACSSVEAAVMAAERRGSVIQLPTIDQLFNRRSHWRQQNHMVTYGLNDRSRMS